MNVSEKIKRIEELIGDKKLLFDKDYQNFLVGLKEEIKNMQIVNKDYLNKKVDNYEDYKILKEYIMKIRDINAILDYIGKEKILGCEKINSTIKDNSKYRVNEVLDKLNIENDELVEKINNLTKRYNGKIIPFTEDDYLNILFDKKIDNNSFRNDFSKYCPVIFQGSKYTRIILKEV